MGVDIITGDALSVLRGMAGKSVNCCVTSPPYWGLRDYGVDGQIGLERTPDEYVSKMVEVFREVRRVLRDDGTLWLNLGDSYHGSGKASGRCWEDGKIPNMSQKQGTNFGSLIEKMDVPNGCKPKDLVGIPWMVAFALRADGWYLRQDIIWHKPNPMPESVTDRCTKAHEYLFLLTKSGRYYCDMEAIAEPATYAGKTVSLGEKSLSRGQANGAGIKASGNGLSDTVTVAALRNRRSVWTVSTAPFPGAHFATFPPKLIEPCILAGCPAGGTVLDPFGGSGTTGLVAEKNGRNSILIELNAKYVDMAKNRTSQVSLFQPK